jgi:hypothetical protein
MRSSKRRKWASGGHQMPSVKARAVPSAPTPARQLDGFIARFSPPMAKLTKVVLKKMRQHLPGAVEMVYDKANALVVGFCPNERASDAITSMAVYSKWINVYFFEGDSLPDPEGILQGNGTMVRYIRLVSATDLERPAVKAILAEAIRRSEPPLDRTAKRRLLIKQVSKGTKVGAW